MKGLRNLMFLLRPRSTTFSTSEYTTLSRRQGLCRSFSLAGLSTRRSHTCNELINESEEKNCRRVGRDFLRSIDSDRFYIPRQNVRCLVMKYVKSYISSL